MNITDKLFIESLNAFKKGAIDGDEANSISTADELYEKAVEYAYRDAQFRTIPHHTTKFKNQNIIRIASKIKDNVESNRKHIDLIEAVKDILYEDFGTYAKEQCFGKAQKIVNMAFKYLYCLNDKSLVKIDYADRDIPLDKNILDFYYTCRKKFENENNEIIINWSYIDKNQYLDIEKNLKEYIKRLEFEMTPIEAEFIIWNAAVNKFDFLFIANK